MQLSTAKYQSRVLMDWLAATPGAFKRAGVEPPAAAIRAMLPENGTVSNLTVDELARALGAATLTAAGVPVTPEVAMRVSAVYGCVALLSGAIATLPLPIFERIDWKTRDQVDHDYWWFLNEKATDGWTTSVAMEYLTSSRFFYGDGFARILRPNNFTNKVSGWRPLHPSRVEPFYESQAGALRYRVTGAGGKSNVLDPADIIHVPSLGFDGLRSPSPITYAARENIGVSLAAQEYTARFFSQGSTHDIAITAPRKLTSEQLEDLRKSYLAKHGGGANARVPLILSGGLAVEKISITPKDAELILLDQFTVEEICRIFGVPPFMVGAMDKTTSWGSGVESMGINFVKYTLRRHLGPIQQELNTKLWPNRERYFTEFDVKALERGDFKTRMEGYRAARGGAGMPGWLTADEIRHEEGYPPIKGGDTISDGGSNAKSEAPAAAG